MKKWGRVEMRYIGGGGRQRESGGLGPMWKPYLVEIIPCGKGGVWVDNDVQYSKVK